MRDVYPRTGQPACQATRGLGPPPRPSVLPYYAAFTSGVVGAGGVVPCEITVVSCEATVASCEATVVSCEDTDRVV
jgi:hypothetical protein